MTPPIHHGQKLLVCQGSICPICGRPIGPTATWHRYRGAVCRWCFGNRPRLEAEAAAAAAKGGADA